MQVNSPMDTQEYSKQFTCGTSMMPNEYPWIHQSPPFTFMEASMGPARSNRVSISIHECVDDTVLVIYDGVAQYAAVSKKNKICAL